MKRRKSGRKYNKQLRHKAFKQGRAAGRKEMVRETAEYRKKSRMLDDLLKHVYVKVMNKAVSERILECEARPVVEREFRDLEDQGMFIVSTGRDKKRPWDDVWLYDLMHIYIDPRELDPHLKGILVDSSARNVEGKKAGRHEGVIRHLPACPE